MPYGTDFRECVVRNIKEGMSWKAASDIFQVSSASLSKWLKNVSETGCVSDRPRKRYKSQKIDEQRLISAIEARPDATLEELARIFSCWPQSVHKHCVKLGITRKKNHAIRRARRREKASVSDGD